MPNRFMVGNTDASSYDPVNEEMVFDVSQTGEPTFTATFSGTVNGAQNTTPLTPGTLWAVALSLAKDAKMIFAPKPGYKIVSIKQYSGNIPGVSDSGITYPLNSDQMVAANDVMRRWLVTTAASAPVVPTKDYAIGDKLTSKYDPEIGGTAYTCEQVGAQQYDALIRTSVYNPVTEESNVVDTVLTGGVVKDVPIPSGATIKLICTPKAGFKISAAKSGGVASIPFNSNGLDYPLTAAALNNVNYRRFEIKTVADVVIPKVTVGNTLTGQVVSQTGDVRYTARIELGFYDPVSEQWTYENLPIALGVPTEVDFKTQTSRTRTLICEVAQGYKFDHASNGDIEIAFTDGRISYPITRAEIDAASDLQRQYFITTTEDIPQPVAPPTVTNNYRVTREELKEFQKLVYSSNVPDDPRKNASEFVSNTFIIPLLIPASEVQLRENIKARDLTFNIADRLKGDTIKINVGNINFPMIHNNALDTVNVSVDLYLPFKSGTMSLDPNQVIGETVNIEYQINPTNGNTTVNVALVNGELISSTTFTIGSEYPFYSFYDIQEKMFAPENVVNDVRAAYAMVKIPNYDSSQTPRVKGSGNIADLSGKVTFDDVEISGINLNDEYEQVIGLLGQGVIFK